MALDGIVIANIRSDLSVLLNGRIQKIAQPEPDALMLTVKAGRDMHRLFISVNASLPLLYLTDENRKSPMTAPSFCMLLRKHLTGGIIRTIEQPGMERVLTVTIEHYDEMGDLCSKKLHIEMMGKHSNIIFCDEQDMILDAIKHVSAQISSVREVLPGRPYFIPAQEGKISPLSVSDPKEVTERICSGGRKAGKAIYTSFTGISPQIASEICYRAGVDADMAAASLSETEKEKLARAFLALKASLRYDAGQLISAGSWYRSPVRCNNDGSYPKRMLPARNHNPYKMSVLPKHIRPDDRFP